MKVILQKFKPLPIDGGGVRIATSSDLLVSRAICDSEGGVSFPRGADGAVGSGVAGTLTAHV